MYWLVRHNDEHVEILRHVEHAVVFVQNRIGNYCRSTGLFVVTGSLSFNGQRCTAIKMIFVPEQYADLIVAKLKDKVERLHIGLPWERHGDDAVLSSITPLPYAGRLTYMRQLIKDAVTKGAKLITGGWLKGGADSTLMALALLYPVQEGMRLYAEEQFGPVVAVGVYKEMDDVLEYSRRSEFAQQVAIFGSDPIAVERLVTKWSSVYGKINWNVPTGRSPDTVPFSGRKSSALGVMSVRDAAMEFSVPTVVSMPKTQDPSGILGSPFFQAAEQYQSR